MNRFTKLIIGLSVVIGILYFIYLWNCEDDWCFNYEWQVKKQTNTFAECVNRGYPFTTNPQGQEVCKIDNKELIK